MSKTPPIVIPVVVDASGVKTGINQANRTVKNAAIGSAAGFGTGGGVASSISTLGVAGAAVASGGVNSSSAFASAQYNEYAKQRSAIRKKHRDRLSKINQMGFIPGLEDDTRQHAIDASEVLRNRQMMRIGGSNAAVALAARGQTGLGRGLSAGMSKMGALGSAARFGLYGGAAYAGFSSISGTVNWNRNMASRYGDLGNFEGTDLYSAARQTRSDYMKDPKNKMGLFDRFFLGARSANNGQAGSVENAVSSASTFIGNRVEEIGRDPLSILRNAGGLNLFTDSNMRNSQMDIQKTAKAFRQAFN